MNEQSLRTKKLMKEQKKKFITRKKKKSVPILFHTTIRFLEDTTQHSCCFYKEQTNIIYYIGNSSLHMQAYKVVYSYHSYRIVYTQYIVQYNDLIPSITIVYIYSRSSWICSDDVTLSQQNLHEGKVSYCQALHHALYNRIITI